MLTSPATSSIYDIAQAQRRAIKVYYCRVSQAQDLAAQRVTLLFC